MNGISECPRWSGRAADRSLSVTSAGEKPNSFHRKAVITDLVQNEQLRGEITAQLAFERSLRLGGIQGIDDVNSVSKQDAVALLAGSVAQSGS
jgi:hypothetical protein